MQVTTVIRDDDRVRIEETVVLTPDDVDVLLRLMQGSLQLMGNGDWHHTIYGRDLPPGGDPPEAERDEDTGYLHCRVEASYVRRVFARLFPGREIYEERPEF
jgi:hypothetical protein